MSNFKTSRRQTKTSDIGIAICDFCEGFAISHIDAGNPSHEYVSADTIDSIDVSDPDNPVFHMESGAQFTVRIVRTA